MFYRVRVFIGNNKYFIPLVSISAALLIVLAIGVLIMFNRAGVLSVRYDASLKAFNEANDKMYSENMAAFEKTILGSFTEEQIIKIGQKNSNYGISINGNPLGKSDSVVYSERPTVAVLLSENFGKDSLDYLPRSVIEKGSIIDLKNAPSLVKVTYGDATLENNVYDYYYGRTLSYLVSGLEPGDIVTIEVNPEIAYKIGMEDNIVEIFYNKEAIEEG